MTGWYNQSAEVVFKQQDSNPDGLTEIDAADRLKRWGSNQLQPPKPITD